MKLYCMRHCDALTSEVDPERHLSEQGEKDAHKIADHLQHQNVHIPHVLHSGIIRAKQTAMIVAKACGAEKIDEVPALLGEMAVMAPLLEMAKTCGDDTLLVGHMPYISQLVAALLMDVGSSAQLISFPPGTMVCLNRLSSDQWLIDWILKPENLGFF